MRARAGTCGQRRRQPRDGRADGSWGLRKGPRSSPEDENAVRRSTGRALLVATALGIAGACAPDAPPGVPSPDPTPPPYAGVDGSVVRVSPSEWVEGTRYVFAEDGTFRLDYPLPCASQLPATLHPRRLRAHPELPRVRVLPVRGDHGGPRGRHRDRHVQRGDGPGRLRRRRVRQSAEDALSPRRSGDRARWPSSRRLRPRRRSTSAAPYDPVAMS